ncbi:hypothetical protein HanXRQr2_Chr02g0078311 [Helianthus annuus]|uniref:Uncharacterized protein n=1 Tax=Helianthus annuus TaxID=4232 RepID=A0A251VHN9_HELAN|nr:hypothetical protein HanXRQr2_Chr02g0078311 [Helianthus annuus]
MYFVLLTHTRPINHSSPIHNLRLQIRCVHVPIFLQLAQYNILGPNTYGPTKALAFTIPISPPPHLKHPLGANRRRRSVLRLSPLAEATTQLSRLRILASSLCKCNNILNPVKKIVIK